MSATYQRWLIARGNVFLPSAAAVAKLVEELRAAHFIIDPASASDLAKLRFETSPAGARAKQTGGYAVKTIENTFDGDESAALTASIESLPAVVSAEWLDDPDREEIRLVWPVDAPRADVPVQYPLSIQPEGDRSRWALEVHRAPEYVIPTASTIGALPTACRCGEELDFEWDEEEVVPAFHPATGVFAECDECSRTFDPSKGTSKITNPFDGSKEDVAGGAAYRFAIKIDCSDAYVKDPKLSFNPALVAIVEKVFGRQFYEVGAVL